MMKRPTLKVTLFIFFFHILIVINFKQYRENLNLKKSLTFYILKDLICVFVHCCRNRGGFLKYLIIIVLKIQNAKFFLSIPFLKNPQLRWAASGKHFQIVISKTNNSKALPESVLIHSLVCNGFSISGQLLVTT